jgi:hypothetical protein
MEIVRKTIAPNVDLFVHANIGGPVHFKLELSGADPDRPDQKKSITIEPPQVDALLKLLAWGNAAA